MADAADGVDRGRVGVSPAGSGVPPEPSELRTDAPPANAAHTDVRRVPRGTRSTAGGRPPYPRHANRLDTRSRHSGTDAREATLAQHASPA